MEHIGFFVKAGTATFVENFFFHLGSKKIFAHFLGLTA